MLKRFLILPSIRTLKRSVQGLCENTGFCTEVFNVLEKKVSQLNDKERLCVLSFDEMAIRPSIHYASRKDTIIGYQDDVSVTDNSQIKVATNALVFMVRGLSTKWKQILGYFLVHRSMPGKSLKTLVVSCISKLQKIGLKVVSTVCDQGSNNISLFNELGLSVDQTSFEVNGEKIFFMFDPPHLLKSFRNNLMRYKLEFERPTFGRVTADWKYVRDYYAIDAKNDPRVTPKLTEMHIKPVGRAKMKVKYAAQALSTSVAASISLLAGVGKFDESAKHTSYLIHTMDKLFDSFNSNEEYGKKKMLCAVKKDSPHLTFWEEMLPFVESWSFKKEDGKAVHVHCKNGWIVTIKSAINLCRNLLEEHNYAFVLTKRFNQDALENTFSVIRAKRGNDENPDCSQLVSCLQAIMVNNIFTMSKATNCEKDFDEVLLSLRDRSPSKFSTLTSLFSDHVKINPDVPLNEIPSLPSDTIRENAIFYIAGYVARKVISKLNCEDCENTLIDSTNAPNVNSLLTQFKDYSGNSLKKPSDALFNIVHKMYDVDICHMLWSPNVIQNMVKFHGQVIDFNALNVHEIHKERVQQIISVLISKVQIYKHIKKVNQDLKQEYRSKSIKK